MTRKELGELFRKERIKQGITQKELSKIVGYTRSAISYVESGDLNISFENADKLAKALGIEITIGAINKK